MSIFLACAVYWRHLGMSRRITLLGLAVLGWTMSFANVGSGLSFDTYFDVLFYLLGALAVLSGRYLWLIPLTGIAAANRETSVLIPFLPLAATVQWKPKLFMPRQALISFAGAITVFVAVYVGIHLYYGPRPMMSPNGQAPGIPLLLYNLSRRESYLYLFATLSVFPFIALARWRKWPKPLHGFFWTIVPVWVFVHLLASTVTETRLFLVPQILIFLPAALVTSGVLQSSDPRPPVGQLRIDE
jgi:hypothetical protein